MKKIIYKKIDEFLYKEISKNGIAIYYYPTTKTKNFLATITVPYGGSVKEYSINNEKKFKQIVPGSAHFLEHKVMNFTLNKEAEKKINDLGLYANAYTSYDVTNYNIYGSTNVTESLKLLLDLFYNPIITKENVESEKGIIIEELEMYKNTPSFRINTYLTSNVFHSSYINDILVGEKADIEKIKYNELIKIYKDFYTSSNAFIILVGNFDLDECNNFITKYIENIKLTKDKKLKIKKIKEQYNVVVKYAELEESISTPKVYYALKIKKEDLCEKDIIKKRYYLNFILSSVFSNSSILYEKYKQKELFINMGYNITDVDDYYFVTISSTTQKPDDLIKELKKDMKHFKVDLNTFNRKKKMFINNLVLGFENIEDVEFMITNNVFRVHKVINNSYEIIESLNYKDMLKYIKSIDLTNYSILKVIPKKKTHE